MHYKHVDQAEARVPECIRNAADDFESMLVPQPHGAFVRADDEVELHCRESGLARLRQQCSHIAPAMPRPRIAGDTM